MLPSRSGEALESPREPYRRYGNMTKVAKSATAELPCAERRLSGMMRWTFG
jgi:hypothetical protein